MITGASASPSPTGDAQRASVGGPAVGRLAPTPSGRLHLGNVVAFGAAWLSARQAGGRIVLRVEDVDAERARPELAEGLREDLAWLGLTWDEERPTQQARTYEDALEALRPHLYACTCTRRQWEGAYPGTCRTSAHADGALRFRLPPGAVAFLDRARGPQRFDPNDLGDPVLRRRDGGSTYALAVVVDDLRDGVTEVVRGADLLEATTLQVRVYEALGTQTPTWLHTPMLVDTNGRKLGKSHGAQSIASLRDVGWRPEDVWRKTLPWLGVHGARHLHEAVAAFRPSAIPTGPIAVADAPETPP